MLIVHYFICFLNKRNSTKNKRNSTLDIANQFLDDKQINNFERKGKRKRGLSFNVEKTDQNYLINQINWF